jgi:hypothetical protein
LHVRPLAQAGQVAGELRWRPRHVLCFTSNDAYGAVPIPEPVCETMQMLVV